MLNADFYPYGSYYANVTGMGGNYFNFELGPAAANLAHSFVKWLGVGSLTHLIHPVTHTHRITHIIPQPPLSKRSV